MNQIERCRISTAEAPVVEARLAAMPRFGRTRRGELTLSLPLTHGGPADTRLGYEIVGREDGGISAGRHVVASDALEAAQVFDEGTRRPLAAVKVERQHRLEAVLLPRGVGIEHLDDLVADISGALARADQATEAKETCR